MQGPEARNLESPPDSYRLRLLEGLAAAVSERGYAATTIAHIVKAARVSKRTFYEHFLDKEDCFLALYAEAAELLRNAVEEALRASAESWETQLGYGIDAYLTALESNPTLTRSILVEIQAAGPRALELRLRSRASFASVMRAFVERVRERHPDVRPLSVPMATALVGGIDELLLVSVEAGAKSQLTEIRETSYELIRAVLIDGRSRAASPGEPDIP